MKLGYIDKVEGQTIHFLPRKRQSDLFDMSENTAEYAQRFYREINGLGNVLLVKIQGGKPRIISNRSF